jgi:hypothetical protein
MYYCRASQIGRVEVKQLYHCFFKRGEIPVFIYLNSIIHTSSFLA